MFTGIIEELGKVHSLQDGRLTVGISPELACLTLGESIAVNGSCLTVVESDPRSFGTDISPETFRRTNLGGIEIGAWVNLERSVAVGGRLGGHIVQGHVDATGILRSREPEGDSIVISFDVPEELMAYVVEKGFIAVDGASLTIVRKHTSSFAISVIPYTIEHTVMQWRQIGDRVNLEVDIIAKYVESLLNPKNAVRPDTHIQE
jgi:riboflavin synthase